MGSPAFMAPEEVRGEEHEIAGDVWSLGCTVVEKIVTLPAERGDTRRMRSEREELRLLGSAIFFEIATLFLLGGLLLFFICKCMIALHIERKNDDNSQSLHKEELIKNHNEKIRRRIRPQESELPQSFASFGNNLQLNSPHIEMQKQPHSD
ncbi:hypothetical protein MA16_Dca008431 [Dendrobium catenatum]|uniref:Protein kinase domain-containing protein n=1 Tax=Dendrobium catenatum TaxID=906689 RepID=A0A2I0VM67_9ASPA|nr:hypothetical protein MA16_Dca008431 [Dendrobium catenatum]